MMLPIDTVRAAFPALALTDAGAPRLYLDAPAGTQVAGRVIDAMRDVMIGACANDGGLFRTSIETGVIADTAVASAAAFFHCADDEVIFGMNTTSIFFQMAPLIAEGWQAGDNILLTRMDHDANVSPWLQAAEARGVEVRFLEWDRETFAFKLETLDQLIDSRTRAVAVGHASNFLGTVNDVAAVCAAARRVGAVSIVDAVQSAPHMALDVQAIGCDLLSASAYKFFGPHLGMAYVSKRLQGLIRPLKVRPSADVMPTRLMPGTPSFEAMAGTTAAIQHLAWLGELAGTVTPDAPLRQRLVAGLAAAQAHETELMRRLLAGIATVPGVTLHGIANANRLHERVATFTFELAGKGSTEVAQALADRNIFVWNGYYYAWEPAGVLGVKERGAVRVGFTHYNSLDEVDRFIAALGEIAGRA